MHDRAGASREGVGRLLVHKYGGTSVADTECIRAVARRIAAVRRDGDRVAVVVSAMAGETNRLLALAGTMQPVPDTRELDALLATGEQAAAALLSMALRAEGCAAESLTGWQAGLETDASHGRARITWLDPDRVREVLDRGGIPVVAGFQGVTPAGDITTIGRGGSDTSAVALAVVLRANECIISTDVDGVYTADPRLVPNARRLDRVTFEEMLELAGLGSRVLQTRSVAFAGRYRVPVRVVSSFVEGAGTLITFEDTKLEAPRIAGIAFSTDEIMVSLRGLPEGMGIWRALDALAGAGAEIDMLSQHREPEKHLDLSFVVHKSDYGRSLPVLGEISRELGIREIVEEPGLAKISVVGVGVRRAHARIAARICRTLAELGIAVRLIASSEIKISVAVEANFGEQAVQALHEAFGLHEVEAGIAAE